LSEAIPRQPDPEQIEAAAAVWLSLRDRGMNPEETAAFMRWLQESPRHAEIFAELDAVWQEFERASALRPAASAEGPTPDLLIPRPLVRRQSSRLMRGLLAAAASLAIAWAGWQAWQATRPTAETSVGAFHRMSLPDGSVVQLNTDSAIKLRYSDHERRIELLRGEAHFDVARNPARPFVVAAGSVAVRAVGTAFNVRRRADAVDVLVTEGKVQLSNDQNGQSLLAAESEAAPPVLVQGERATVALDGHVTPGSRPAAVAVMAPVEVRRALAWQERRLVFEDLALGEVVAEFNRYNETKLVIDDPVLAARRFSGTFRPDAYEPFVRLLEENFRISAVRDARSIRLESAR